MMHAICPYCDSPYCTCFDTDEEYEQARAEIMSSKTPKPICERIGEKIRWCRVERGPYMKQRALAALLETSPSYLCDIEMGRAEPGAGMILRLCRVLKVSADWLLGVNEDEPDGSASRVNLSPEDAPTSAGTLLEAPDRTF